MREINIGHQNAFAANHPLRFEQVILPRQCCRRNDHRYPISTILSNQKVYVFVAGESLHIVHRAEGADFISFFFFLESHSLVKGKRRSQVIPAMTAPEVKQLPTSSRCHRAALTKFLVLIRVGYTYSDSAVRKVMPVVGNQNTCGSWDCIRGAAAAVQPPTEAQGIELSGIQ